MYKPRLSCKLKEKSENRDSYKFLCHLQYCFDIGWEIQNAEQTIW